jgi:putative transcriptional regulator
MIYKLAMISSVVKIRLKELLEEKGKTLYRLEKETGITFPTLSKLNKGEGQGITFEVLEKICINLDCTASDLLAIEK